VKLAAQKYDLPLAQFASLKKAESIDTLKNARAHLFVVLAYGKILPNTALVLPSLGSINVHPSLLPLYRGPDPIRAPILRGDGQTGLSIMLLDEGMDTGPLLAQIPIAMEDDETVQSLEGKFMRAGPPLLLETIRAYAAGTLEPVPQKQEGIIVTKMLHRDDGKIDWRESADMIERKSRAYHPWPGLWTLWTRGERTLRMKSGRLGITKEHPLPAGRVEGRDGRLLVGTATAPIEIFELQLEGKSKMTAPEFLRGYSDIAGAVLG
jgi:methionyl-tRNA formyltransferase